METSAPGTEDAGGTAPRDGAYWATNVERLTVPAELKSHGYNIDGKRVAGPQQGFGRLWQRTYSADLGHAVAPERLVSDWRAHFGSYWPRMGRFYGSMSAIQPGDVAALTAGGVSTGILVLYADETSFTFLTPEGHMFAAMITFSAEHDDDSGATIAQIQMLLRPSDPLFEAVWPLARRSEDVFWPGTLRNLAAAHGVAGVEVARSTECVDRKRLWRNWRNVRYNAGIRTVWHVVTVPFRSRSAHTTT